jgi:hypothetical protein
MPKSSYALAASNIKKELAAAFPGIKFSTRSKSFSMGDSVDVSWELGPTTKEVDAIIGKYEYGRFDGMQDLQYNDQDPERCAFRATHGEAKYVHGSRSKPDGLYEQMCRDIAQHLGIEYSSPYSHRENDTTTVGEYAQMTFSRASFPAGATYIGVASSWELTLTGACCSTDAIRIIHSKTDEESGMRQVVKREFDRVKAFENRKLHLVA